MASTTKDNKTEVDKAVETIREKPLNQTQLKNLRELVNGDFRDLQEEVAAEIDRRYRAKVAEIEEEYAKTADLDKARDKARDEVRKAEDKLVAALEKILNNPSLTLESRYGESKSVAGSVEVSFDADRIKQKGKDEAIKKADQAKHALEMAARRVMNREQRAVDRQCLLQGISAYGAHELIRDLPEAADILPLVSAEMQMKESEAMDLLMSDVKALEGES